MQLLLRQILEIISQQDITRDEQHGVRNMDSKPTDTGIATLRIFRITCDKFKLITS